MTFGLRFAEVAIILQFATDNSIVNNIVTSGVTCLDLKNPSAMAIGLKTVVLESSHFYSH